MNVNEVYELMQLIFAKNTQQGYVSPQDFNNSINQAQRQYLDFLLGEYQKYQIKRPIPVVAFSQNERIRDSISPLIYNIVLDINQTTGLANRPSDYEYVDTMFSLYNIYNIKFIQQDRLFSYNRSVIDPIEENPVYLIQHEGFHFYPSNPYGYDKARMTYVRNPPPITWGYYEDGNGQAVYDPLTSQQPIWSDSDIFQIIVRACSILGLSMQVNTVLAYSNDIKNGGQ